MAGTRVKILTDLEDWASDDLRHKVYWLVGMAGTGKSSISQSFCEILDGKNMLGASFFCSRASEKTNNARFIVPAIAHGLSRASPSIQSQVVKAIEDDPALAESTYSNLNNQFEKLICHPIRTSVDLGVKTYKIVVIDAVDECIDVRIVSLLIQVILKSVSKIPLKIFIASRDERPIHNAFSLGSDIRKDFVLHEVEKDVVKDDIHKYLEQSLSDIKKYDLDDTPEEWPSHSELSALADRSGTLFIYAATSIRYIDDGDGNYRDRLTFMISSISTSGSKLQTATIDNLYGHILQRAFALKEHREACRMKTVLATTIFLRTPLPIQSIASLLAMDEYILSASLWPLKSVIHVPTHKEAAVTPFHASFPDFITTSARCLPFFDALVASEGHEMLALKCLEHMNRSLKYNICGTPKASTMSCRGTTNSPESAGKISEALKYSCLFWASHLAEVHVSGTDLVTTLHSFLHQHLLHWIECLSAQGELQTGSTSLRSASATLSVSGSSN
jgi:hypothetical protein